MIVRIEHLQEKKLVGKKIKMCYADNKTSGLWQSFMKQRKEIQNAVTNDLISMQLYDHISAPKDFNANTVFEKWAAVEVADFNYIPTGMKAFTLTGGLYAIFEYIGPASQGATAFHYIFSTWLPASDYLLDDRPHFEILGKKYKNEDPDSEEEIWIPITSKN
jgi:AraC family transcriptional regulator